jgi:hypothetical protein
LSSGVSLSFLLGGPRQHSRLSLKKATENELGVKIAICALELNCIDAYDVDLIVCIQTYKGKSSLKLKRRKS